ncbi:pseudaminic acid cytidylyltransferase [Pseudaeromonas sharmana]|uniref:Pseudaminic acid cytidylyltransferase n=1 Tax=Pseudaeromonas sharmana TaxID=328412 RepID=A0ABV8CJ70_9GAMM
MTIAIIPARGGSKRIPRKNIRDFCGQPMISYAIAAARAAGCFEHIIVSTDDAEIAAVARDHGATTPFLRAARLADDHTGTAAVVVDAIQQLDRRGLSADSYCCIYATVPLIRACDLLAAYQRLNDCAADFAFSAAAFGFPIQRALQLAANGCATPFWPENMAKRSQDLTPAYQDAGQFYWGRREAWLEGRGVFDGNGLAHLLPRYRVVDIDTEEDWQLAELLYQALQQHDAG